MFDKLKLRLTFLVNETGSCNQLSDSSVIKQNINNTNEQNLNNVCILKHCNQEEEEDVSISSDLETEEAIEDNSIVADKYSITPGKQRLFDVRHTKPSFCAKLHVASAPFMDKIEETTTPIPEKLVSPILTNNISHRLSETKENLNLSLMNSMNCSSINLNLTSNEIELESSQCIDKIDKVLDSNFLELNAKEEMTKNDYVKHTTISKCDVKNIIDIAKKSIVIETEVESANNSIGEIIYENEPSNESASDYNVEKSGTLDVEITLSNTDVENTVCNVTTSNNMFFGNNKSMTNKIINTSNVADHFDLEKPVNTVSNLNIVTMADCDSNANKSETMKTEIESANTNVVDDIKSNVSMCNNTFFTDNKSMSISEPLNKTNTAENILNVVENQFDLEKSVNTVSNINISTIDDCIDNNVEKSEAMELEVESAKANVVNTKLNVSTCNNTLFINNRSMSIYESLNNTNKAENISNVTENQFDLEKSLNAVSIINISRIDNCVDNNAEKSEVREVEVESINTNIVDTKSNVSMCSNTFFIDNRSMSIDKSLNKTNETENILNVVEGQFDLEKSVNTVSNINTSTISGCDYNAKKSSEAMEVEVELANIDVVDIKSNLTMCSNTYSKRNRSNIVHENELLNITENSSYLNKHKFDLEVSGNISDLIVPNIISKETLQSDELCNILEHSTNSDVFYSKENESTFSNKVSEMYTMNLVHSSNDVKQYLNFEQTQIEMCDSMLLDNNSKLSKSIDYCNQSQENISMIEQTICSETTDDIIKVTENYSILDSPKSNLSVIIENRTLEDEIMIQNKITESTDNDISNLPISKNTTNKILDESINKDASSAIVEPMINETNTLEVNTESNENNVIDKTIIGSELSLNKNQDTISNVTLNSNISMATTKLSINKTNTEMDNQLNNKIPERLISGDITKNQNDLMSFSMFNSNEEAQKPENSFQNFTDQEHILNMTDSVSNSLAEFTKLEQMIIEEDKKIHAFKTPKTQKLFDFSIVQQTPTFNSQAKKQKLFDFSIIEQSPMSKSIQQVSFNHEPTKKDALIDFSSVGQMWDLDLSSTDKMNFNEDFQNSSKMFTSNNLSTISVPDIKLLDDESIISNSSFNQTITDANLNQSTYNEMNKTQNNANSTNNVQSSGNDDSIMLTNTQIEVDMTCNFINISLEQNKSCDKQFKKEMEGAQPEQPECSTDIILNKNFKAVEPNKQFNLNSRKHNIVDFSIIEQPSEFKNIENITCAESDNNVCNLMEMSVVSMSDTLSNKQFVSSKNPVIVVTNCNESEKTLSRNSDDNNTTVHFKDSQSSYNTEFLTDIQMNDMSLLMESSEKSSISESFHSIENDYRVQEDNKRKLEPTQEYHNDEKKMKVVNTEEETRTPISMLYKIKNMFRSNEKSLHCAGNTKKNVLQPNEHRQKLNFSKCEENDENFPKSLNYKKSELLVKSKIPCKVLTDRSMTKNDEFNLSTSSLNDHTIKPKKTIPKYSGLPVLSDVSNSSTKKLVESRIPSKFQK